ncbi:peptidase S26 [mine drainage metagenome]|uniref:Peptidase S26 n=1 Tax=mine drainage metagenome TaxID=410659 RepID=A0A1J5RN22_9ZZZZ
MTRFGWLMITYFWLLAIGASVFHHPTPRLLWNATASTPTGLYAVQPVRVLHVGDLVAVMPPEPVARFLADGGYLPQRVPLLKHVAALPGDIVCRSGHLITIDGIVIGEARDRDSRGRGLPVWSGCRVLADGEVFLMNRHPDSLDGRYFGPLPAASIIGRAVPLWTNDRNEFPFHS